MLLRAGVAATALAVPGSREEGGPAPARGAPTVSTPSKLAKLRARGQAEREHEGVGKLGQAPKKIYLLIQD